MEPTNGNGGESRWERPDAPLGTLIYRAGLLSKDKLESALQESVRSGRRLGEVLLQKGWIDEKDLARLLAGQKGLAFVSLRGRGVDPETARMLSEEVARFHHAIPFETDGDELLVAVADPTDNRAVEAIGSDLDRRFKLVVATATEIRNALDEAHQAPVELPAALAAPAVVAEAAPVVPPASAPVAPVAPPPPAASPAESPLRLADPPAVEPEPEPEPEPAPEPELEPVAEVPAATPPPEPETVPDPRPAVEPEPTTRPEPAPLVSRALPPLPEPTIQRDDAAHVSVAFNAPRPVHEPSPEPPAPAAAREPEQEHTAAPEPESAAPSAQDRAEAARYRLVLELEGSEEVEVGLFEREEEAEAAARELMARLGTGGDWPKVGQRFIRPERVISIEIRERARFKGAESRARWFGPPDSTPAPASAEPKPLL